MKVPAIADSEWAVMKVVWNKYPITSNEIVKSLERKIHWNHRTIRTLIGRLVGKKALGFERKGRQYHYFPLVTKDECAWRERKSLLSKVYNGSLKPMLLAFIEDAELSKEEVDELKAILNKKKEDKKK